MSVIDESEWYKSFTLDIDLDKLRVWARLNMLNTPAFKSHPKDHETALYWDVPPSEELAKRLSEVSTLNTDPGCNTAYIWEFHDGGPLVKHFDGDMRGSNLVVPLIGGFEIYRHDEDGSVVDSYQYEPGKIFVLKNGHTFAHSGVCLNGYRLAVVLFSDPLNDPFRQLDDHIIEKIKYERKHLGGIKTSHSKHWKEKD